MTAHQLLKRMRDAGMTPQSREGAKLGIPSNSELFRWLRNGSVKIDGMTVAPASPLEFPILDITFFSGKNKVSMGVST